MLKILLFTFLIFPLPTLSKSNDLKEKISTFNTDKKEERKKTLEYMVSNFKSFKGDEKLQVIDFIGLYTESIGNEDLKVLDKKEKAILSQLFLDYTLFFADDLKRDRKKLSPDYYNSPFIERNLSLSCSFKRRRRKPR